MGDNRALSLFLTGLTPVLNIITRRLTVELGNTAKEETSVRAQLALSLFVLASLLPSQPATASASNLADVFITVSNEFSVPTQVLMAVSYAETRWEDHGAQPSRANGYGLMHLQDNTLNDGLRRAATLLGVPPKELWSSTVENVRGGASLLRVAYVSTYGDDPLLRQTSNLARWYVPVASYLRSDELEPQRSFADRVFFVLERGVQRTLNGEILKLPAAGTLRPERGRYASVNTDATYALVAKETGNARTTSGKLAAAQATYVQGGADSWYPAGTQSPNYTPGRPGNPTGLVMHTCQGEISSCLSSLTTWGTRKSAHYVVRSSDGWRYQLVHRQDQAWQCGFCKSAPYGGSWNDWTIGIELEGFSNDPARWYTGTMYSRTAWLAAWACYDYNFSGCLQYNGLYGHDYAEPGNSDPGGGFDWYWFANTCVYERLQFIRFGQPIQSCP